MKIKFHESLDGMNCIKKVAKTKQDYVDLVLLIEDLIQDTQSALIYHGVSKVRGTKLKIYEIRKNDYRLFYTIKSNVFTILDIAQKKKNKTEKKVLGRVFRRAKNN